MNDVIGHIVMVLGGFLVGLTLNLTPCVYPMLAVTLSIFGKQEDVNRKTAFLRAVVYVLGISTMYSILGVSAALTGQLFGAALQSSWVLLGIAIVLLILSLGMFGLYQFQLPSWFLNLFAKRRGVHLWAIYVSGLFVGVFAAPCIGPPILALLTLVGTQRNPLFAFEIFFVLSLGLGFPYLILGTFSGLLNRLPKSGMWMVWIERLFGVVLLSLAAFYAMTAIDPSLLRIWLPLSLIAGGIYLGFVEKSGGMSSRFATFKKFFGTLAIVAGILFPVFQPSKSLIDWEPFRAQKLIEANQKGQPVVLDFYADWCIPCHELENFTFSNKDVAEALKPFRKIRVDLTNPSSSEVVDLVRAFNVDGVPTVIFLNARGEEIEGSRVAGFIPPKSFARRVRVLTPEAKKST